MSGPGDLRRLVVRRTISCVNALGSKNQVHGILARNLVPTCPHADMFSGVGRRWMGQQDVPADERRSIEALLRQLDFHGAGTGSARPGHRHRSYRGPGRGPADDRAASTSP